MPTTKKSQKKKVRVQLNADNGDPTNHNKFHAYLFRNIKQTIKTKSLEMCKSCDRKNNFLL